MPISLIGTHRITFGLRFRFYPTSNKKQLPLAFKYVSNLYYDIIKYIKQYYHFLQARSDIKRVLSKISGYFAWQSFELSINRMNIY